MSNKNNSNRKSSNTSANTKGSGANSVSLDPKDAGKAYRNSMELPRTEASNDSTVSNNQDSKDRENTTYVGFQVVVQLQDGKEITGTIYKYNGKTLVLSDASFGDGGKAALFKVKANRLKDLKVTEVPPRRKKNGQSATERERQERSQYQNESDSEFDIASNKNKNLNTAAAGRHPSSGSSGGSFWDDDVQKIKERKDDFDFQGNLNLFDKTQVFEKIKLQDQMEASQRLVNVNKPQPAYPLKQGSIDIKVNYNHNENVLQNVSEDGWNSISSPVLLEGVQSPRSISSELVSLKPEKTIKNKDKKQNSKEHAKKIDEKDFFPITDSINITHLLKKSSSNIDSVFTKAQDEGHGGKNEDDDFLDNSEVLAKLQQVLDVKNKNYNNIRKQSFSMTSPVIQKKFVTVKNYSNSSTSNIDKNATASNTIGGGITIPAATPVQLLEIDRFTTDEYLFPYLQQVEQSCLTLSQYIKKNKFFGDIRLNNKKSNTPPLIVILATNNTKIGLLSIVLGRILSQNSHIRVLTYLFETDGEKQAKRHGSSRNNKDTSTDESDIGDDYNSDGANGGTRHTEDRHGRQSRKANLKGNGDTISREFQAQLQLYKKFGGKIINNFHTFTSTLNRLNSPVELILDGLQGYDFNIEDLLTLDPPAKSNTDFPTSTTKEEDELISLMDWCNDKQQQRCTVWSLEIPSGIDPNTGDPNFITSIDPDCIISFGLPLNVLLYLDTPSFGSSEEHGDGTEGAHSKKHYLINMGVPSGVYLLKSTLRKFYAPIDEAYAVENIVELNIQE
ncbi:hypothetical protein ACO0RG_004634 [Hanseniaspora osmophila]